VVSLTVDPLTNRISTFGFSYDAAGNLIQWPGGTVTISAEYDVEGRLSRVLYNDVEQEKYFYNARNQRVKNRYSPLRVYGLGGELLGEYVPEPGFTRPTRWLERVYFAGACVGEVDSYGGWRLPSVDRLGSLKQGSGGIRSATATNPTPTTSTPPTGRTMLRPTTMRGTGITRPPGAGSRRPTRT
jgi:hypothetical protein